MVRSIVDFKLVKWLRKNTLDRLSFTHSAPEHESGGVWKERKDAEVALKGYLSEYPCETFSTFSLYTAQAFPAFHSDYCIPAWPTRFRQEQYDRPHAFP